MYYLYTLVAHDASLILVTSIERYNYYTVMKYYFAPVQGHTDAAYRNIHSGIYGTNTHYFTPFIRLEKGEIRKKDMKDADAALTSSPLTIPQVIFRDKDELSSLVRLLKEAGHSRIDINMGCPFPLQTARGRGAATVSRPECAEAVSDVVSSNPDIRFSLKMRLGMNDDNEWKSLLGTLNDLPLEHLAVHPRIARDQYNGDLRLDRFEELLALSRVPVVYNGDIHTPEDASCVLEKFPTISGIMIGRGVLGRPSLITECLEGEEWSHTRRLEKLMEFHDTLLEEYRDTLIGGEHQILSKIQPFWEYAEQEIGRKAWKAIRKATNMAKYETAVAMI